MSERFRRLETRIGGLVLIEPHVIRDDRGLFFETFRADDYAELGVDVEFVQDNHSRSVRGTVRALGWQPQVHFAEGLEQTVAWYRDNPTWWEPIRSGDYREYYERHYGRSLG